MKVVCIDDGGVTDMMGQVGSFVTAGKIYQVTRPDLFGGDGSIIYIIGNNGKELAMKGGRFRPLDEIRLEKLEEILK